MKASIAQWIGCRDKQEDSYRVKYFPDGLLVVVADGMGGHHNGELASAEAVRAFEASFADLTTEGRPVAERLMTALNVANDAVGHAFADCSNRGGTTLVAAFIGQGVIRWVSVGDSPLLLWRGGRLLRLNADHSLRAILMEYVSAGTMSHSEAMQRGHQLRSALTGAGMALVDAPATPKPLLPGDRIIVATDGVDDLLLAPVLTDEVRGLLSDRDGNVSVRVVEACQALNDPGADNVTVVSVDWP